MKRTRKYERWLTVGLLILSIACGNTRPGCACGTTATDVTTRLGPAASGEEQSTCCCGGFCGGECCEACCCGKGPVRAPQPVAPPTRTNNDEQVVVAASAAALSFVFTDDAVSGAAQFGRIISDGSLAVPSLQSRHVRIQT